jgi:hypothetical protein
MALDTIFNHAKEEKFINGGYIVHSEISVSFFYGTHIVIPSSMYLAHADWWLGMLGIFFTCQTKSTVHTDKTFPDLHFC